MSRHELIDYFIFAPFEEASETLAVATTILRVREELESGAPEPAKKMRKRGRESEPQPAVSKTPDPRSDSVEESPLVARRMKHRTSTAQRPTRKR